MSMETNASKSLVCLPQKHEPWWFGGGKTSESAHSLSSCPTLAVLLALTSSFQRPTLKSSSATLGLAPTSQFEGTVRTDARTSKKQWIKRGETSKCSLLPSHVLAHELVSGAVHIS